jgi:acetyl esterase/lipase
VAEGSVVSSLLDPEIAERVAALPPFVFDRATLPVVRELIPGPVPPPADIDRSDYVVDDAVTLSIHRPRGVTAKLPAVYWIHGGGYVMGHRHMDNDQLERWSRTLQCACIAVEYRLAPEFPHPIPLEDCSRGLQWVAAHADDIGIDIDNLGIGGRSAGGGLAAALAVLTRERSAPTIRFQILDCPMLDDRRQSTSSRLPDLPIWSRESNEFGWRSYLSEAFGTDTVPPLAAPARATDLIGLPPAFIAVGTVDGVREEAIDYALRLNQADVPTELHVYPGVPHGVLIFPDAAVTQRTIRDLDDYLDRALNSKV